MLTGNEKIKNLKNDDICNYLGFALLSKGAIKVEIKTQGYYDTYKVLYVSYSDGVKTRIAFNSDRAINSTIDEIKEILIHSLEFQRKVQNNGNKNWKTV